MGDRTLTVRWLGTTPYNEAWALQRMLAAQRAARLIGNQLLLLEHPPVFTMGRGGEPSHLGEGADALVAAGAEYVDVDRGGSVTFHGPGQLVAYPILRLADVVPIPQHSARGDVLRYVRGLEQAAIATAAWFGISAE
ncbi:MAG: octanoyltransferase, partial [Candidatus Dormibacteraeota bacterium]|nr:octanoyltransferase [Candidatus Dormibacteraeota bacterium]